MFNIFFSFTIILWHCKYIPGCSTSKLCRNLNLAKYFVLQESRSTLAMRCLWLENCLCSHVAQLLSSTGKDVENWAWVNELLNYLFHSFIYCNKYIPLFKTESRLLCESFRKALSTYKWFLESVTNKEPHFWGYKLISGTGCCATVLQPSRTCLIKLIMGTVQW